MTSDREEYDFGAVWRMTVTNEEFAEAACRPDEWINAARRLQVGAYVLKAQNSKMLLAKLKRQSAGRSIDLLFTALFLASLSLENVLKAVLLVRKPSLVQKGKLRFGNWGHDLVRLARESNFDLGEQEAGFLRVSCNPCILSFGRYPMALSKADAPKYWQLHTSAFGFFESIFMRAAETALQEGRNGADVKRIKELERVLEELRHDVPPSTMCS